MSEGPAGPVVVRRATPGDVGEVWAIESRSFADPWTEDAFHSSLGLPHMRFLVAEVEGRAGDGNLPEAGAGARTVAGYVLAMVLGDEGEIADIAVSPAVRGAGIGGVLLDRATEALSAAGVRTLFLEVRESNAAARRLYASRGFGPVGRRRGYYQHPVEDALVLMRVLDGT